MNRHARRALERQLKAGVGKLTHPVPESVSLRGGPMDGWVVKPGAPALAPDWWTTWPVDVARRHAPGRYVVDAGQARWVADA